MADQAAPAENVFMVVGNQSVVVLDLSQTIETLRPDAVVLHARSAQEALTLLTAQRVLVAAILCLSTEVILNSGLSDCLIELGAAILQISDDSTAPAGNADWLRIGTPFSSEIVAVSLSRLGVELATS